ncbi:MULTISPECIES: hypothetical protein [unclassified Agarivorans]|uniref:hypothetical protein n=1 Tax=unclassified Agarivorans TaxID=2636026 RepID=UPI003D7F1395
MHEFEFGLLILIPASLLSGLFCAKLASNKGKSISVWAFIGSIMGPLAVPFVILQKKGLSTQTDEKIKRGFVYKLLLIDITIVFLLEFFTLFILFAAIFTGEMFVDQLSQVQLVQLVFSFLVVVFSIIAFLNRLKNPVLFFYMVLFLYSFNYASGVLNWEPSTYEADNLKLAMSKLIMLFISIRCVFWPLYAYVQLKKQGASLAPKETEINKRQDPVFSSIVE